MGKGFCIVSALSVSFLLITLVGCQDSERFAIAGKAGTLGLGGEVTAKVVPALNVRAGINGLDLDFDDQDFEDIRYKTGIELSSYSLLADWNVFEGNFHITGGVISMDNKLKLDASPKEDVQIGDTTYTPAEVGTLRGRIEIDDMAPYLGIGWGNPFAHNSRWGLTCDFGVAFIDSPEVSLTSTGIVSAADLSREIQDMEDDLEPIKFYPVIALGLYFRF